MRAAARRRAAPRPLPSRPKHRAARRGSFCAGPAHAIAQALRLRPAARPPARSPPPVAARRLQIKNCDAILGHMEQMLGRFQGDLGKVSEEIRQLQVQSQTMSMKLKNRRAAEAKLGNFVNQVTVPEDLVTNIFEAEVCVCVGV